MRGYGIVEGMKDFYWDIRPKPEYGTIEIRVCDTPLTVRRAALLAGYAQALAAWLLEERTREPIARGLPGERVQPLRGLPLRLRGRSWSTRARGAQAPIGEDILDTAARGHAAGDAPGLRRGGARARRRRAARLLGRRLAARAARRHRLAADVVREAAALWARA